MKFCSKCGAELFDDAIVCVKCGRAVGVEKAEERIDKKDEVPTKKASMLVPVFDIVTTVFTALSVFFLLVLIAHNIPVRISVFDYYALYQKENSGICFYAVNCLIYSITSFGFALATFITCLVRKQQLERLFTSISKLVIGFLVFLASLIVVF